VADADLVVADAVRVYRALLAREDVQALVTGGVCYYEVPFTFFLPDEPGTAIRGTVDCVVVGPDGRYSVLEFKTGRPRPEHDTQVALYARALSAMLGGAPVATHLCYP
jgi:ATP-dependent exoDNAse (exonuclease V) beta subunit